MGKTSAEEKWSIRTYAGVWGNCYSMMSPVTTRNVTGTYGSG